MASSLTTFAFAIKDRYNKASVVENLTMSESPLMAMISKDTDFAGDGTHIPLIYANPQGVSGALSRAQTVSATTGGNIRGAKFILKAGDYLGAVSINDKLVQQSRNNMGAFLQNRAAEIDGLYTQMASDLATYMYGNSGNSIGVVSSIASLVITLTEPTQTMNFEVGMQLERNTVDGSDGTTAATAETYTVTAVDRAGGTITIDATTNLAATHFLFRKGTYRGNTGVFIFHGLQDFIWPDNSPPVIYSMTRTADTQRLAGSRVNAADITGLGIEERLQVLGTYMTGRYKGPGPSHVFLNPEDWTNLSISLQSRGQRPLKDESTRFGFMAIECIMGGVQVKVYADRYCPKGTAFALRLKNWTLHSIKDLIHPIEEDGLTLLRNSTTNDYEYRLVSYPSLCTNAPGHSGRVALAA